MVYKYVQKYKVLQKFMYKKLGILNLIIYVHNNNKNRDEII